MFLVIILLGLLIGRLTVLLNFSEKDAVVAKKWSKIVGLLTVLALTGCVNLRVPDEDIVFKHVSPAARQEQLGLIRHWRITGAFSIRVPGQSPALANYVWNQLGQNSYRIKLASSLNLYTAMIVGRYGSVTLWKTSTKHFTAKTPEALMEREMGWYLPIRDMFYWVRGIPAPGKAATTFDQYGHLRTLRQKGWIIDYDRYQVENEIDLPRLITMQRGNIHVRLVIKGWKLLMKPLSIQEPD